MYCTYLHLCDGPLLCPVKAHFKEQVSVSAGLCCRYHRGINLPEQLVTDIAWRLEQEYLKPLSTFSHTTHKNVTVRHVKYNRRSWTTKKKRMATMANVSMRFHAFPSWHQPDNEVKKKKKFCRRWSGIVHVRGSGHEIRNRTAFQSALVRLHRRIEVEWVYARTGQRKKRLRC